MDPGITCFNHCNSKIYLFNVPDYCPLCKIKLEESLIPFRIPYPFIKASQNPYSVILKPTKGNFLDDYVNHNDLHIGITGINGTVFEFDTEGLVKNKSDTWNQSLLIFQISKPWNDHWDKCIDKICNKWKKEGYNEVNNNCYTFVLDFLRLLNYKEINGFLASKSIFCEKFILPKTVIAAGYVSIYRKIKNGGYFAQSCDKK